MQSAGELFLGRRFVFQLDNGSHKNSKNVKQLGKMRCTNCSFMALSQVKCSFQKSGFSTMHEFQKHTGFWNKFFMN